MTLRAHHAALAPIPLEIPRDRNGPFEPALVPKHQRRLEGFNEMVCSLVARGLSARDTIAHLYETYGVEVSPELVSKITDAVLPELREWQSRPLDAVYPILYLDAIVVKVRADHPGVNKAVHIALGVDVDGRKHVGMWMQREEGAKFWLGVLTEIRNRGVRDHLIEFITQLRRHLRGNKATLIWDGLPSHHSRAMCAFLLGSASFLVP